MKTVSVATLGCKVNQYESEAMLNLFSDAGYTVKNFDEVCDIYVINTCTVTSMGDRKSRQMIHRAVKQNPDALVAVAGCYSQVSPEAVQKIEGVDLVIGTKERSRIVELCQEVMQTKQKKLLVDDALKRRSYEDMTVSTYSDRTRAFVKIEDGCTEFCTYCIIPYARGPVRSRSLQSIVDEVTALSQNGFKEIVLTGIHLASYGKDIKEYSLADVIEAVARVDGIRRVRLGSIEPGIITPEFVKRIAAVDKLCNHFHVALQSGCDETLKRMNRKYTTAQYRSCVELLRKHFDNPAIATDIMAGFPGETEEEFASSLEFAVSLELADAHVFAYSNRKGTKADKMPGQVPKSIKDARSRKLISALGESRKRYLGSLLGTCGEVLFEQKTDEGMYEGHLTNYVKVIAASDTDISGRFATVRFEEIKGDVIFGVITNL